LLMPAAPLVGVSTVGVPQILGPELPLVQDTLL
jgi:hypothetical protein